MFNVNPFIGVTAMKRIFTSSHILTPALLLLVFFASAGCRHDLITYTDKVVKEDNRIYLKDGGPTPGVWKTEDLTLNYEYRKRGSDFEISGTIAFDQHLEYNYHSFTNFWFQVYFTDPEGIILAEQFLGTAGYKQEIEDMTFNKRFSLPPNAGAMAFGYSGKAEDASDDADSGIGGGGTDWSFWKTPTR